MTTTAPLTDRQRERPATSADCEAILDVLDFLTLAERGGATVVRIEHLRVLLGGAR